MIDSEFTQKSKQGTSMFSRYGKGQSVNGNLTILKIDLPNKMVVPKEDPLDFERITSKTDLSKLK